MTDPIEPALTSIPPSFGSQVRLYSLITVVGLTTGVIGIWLALMAAVAFGRWIDG